MKFRLLIILFLFTNIQACKDKVEDVIVIEEEEEEEEEEMETDEIPTIIPTGNEAYLSEDSDYIFNQAALHTFELKLPVASLEQLDNDPTAEEYVAGTLIFQGDTISPVGIRYKGSIGAFVNCLSGSGFLNPSGYKTCTKLSMKVKINWEGREERFFGLKKIQLHSQNNDASQMRDRLGYWLFKEMGVPSPRAVHARLVVNGEYVGLFSLVEQIDGRFTRHNFEDGKGNLYKEIWPLTTSGAPQSEQAYINSLKTNEDENPSVHIIKNFAQAIADAEDEDLKTVIANTMDIDKIMAYCVVDRTIRHDDGPFHWYCVGNCFNHNYFWYEEPNAEKLHLIPWDLDNTFNNINGLNTITTITDDWGEISNNCQPFSNGGGFALLQRSAACDKLTYGWTTYEEEFETIKQAFIDGPFSESETNSKLDEWAAQIQAATAEASDLHDDAVKPSTWQSEIEALKVQLSIARQQ